MNFKEYILTCIGEEGGEVSQASSKCMRFGLTDNHPQEGYKNNIDSLIQEVNDLIAIVELLGENGFADTSLLNDFTAKRVKKEKFFKYLNYAENCGTVTMEIPKPKEVIYTPKLGESYCKGSKNINSHCGNCPKCRFYGWTR